MSKLFSAGNIGNLTFKNRWIMLAMQMGFADENGGFTKRDFDFYKRRAEGGVAAISTVACVNQEGWPDNMHRLDIDDVDEDIKRLADMAHSYDCKFIMHLFHAGRNRNNLDNNPVMPVCPSDVPSPIYRFNPRVMTEDDILRTIDDFAKAALKCKKCGVDMVEVSASVGYILSQFMSPLVNKRTDEWGGSPEKRLRFPTEVLKAIRKAVGTDYPVIAKISCGDMLGGYDVDYMIYFINQLPPGTLDGITLTGGWHEAPVPQMTYHVKPGAFRELYHKVKAATDLPVIACNRVSNAETAEEMIANGDCDFTGTARPLLTDPDFVKKMENGVPYSPCQACNKGCIERVLRGKDCVCAFNPEAGHEYLGRNNKEEPSNVLVAGGGPVGLAAAKYEVENGNNVTIITDASEWGGKISIASVPPHKKLLKAFTDSMIYDLKQLGAEMRTDEALTEKIVKEKKWDRIYLAFGAEPVIPEIKGIESIKHITAEDYLSAPEYPGKRVIVVGGGTVGLETAETIATMYPDTSITVVEALNKVGKDFGGKKWIMMKSLKEKGVVIKTETMINSFSEKGAEISSNGNIDYCEADLVIFAVGSRSRNAHDLEKIIKEEGIQAEIIGDIKKPSDIMNGIFDAYAIANDKQGEIEI